MNSKHPQILAAALSLSLLLNAFGLAYAKAPQDEETKEIQLFSLARVTLTEAIKAAELKTGGKAMEAELNDESATVQFKVEVLKDGKTQDVFVDGKTGQVLKVAQGEDEASEAGEENEAEKDD